MGLPSLCPQYVKLWKQIKETDDYKRIVEKEKPIIDYVLKMSNTTKLPYLLPTDYLYSVYFCFYAMVRCILLCFQVVNLGIYRKPPVDQFLSGGSKYFLTSSKKQLYLNTN